MLPPGEYVLDPPKGETSALVLPNGTTLRGSGRDQTRISMADGAFGHLINAPEGGVRISDLTLDGRSSHRRGAHGHNVRLEGDDNVIERVRCLDACSYGIGLGQRRYVRRTVLRDIDIVGTGADGVDMKNKLGQTEVTIINVSVQKIGQAPWIKGSAAIDLRGVCKVSRITIKGIEKNDGLRFRHGEAGILNGAGAHGSSAEDIHVDGAGTAVAVVARDVRLSRVETKNVKTGIGLGANGLVVQNGVIQAKEGLKIYKSQTGITARLEEIRFEGNPWHPNSDVHGIQFIHCDFSGCEGVKPHSDQILNPTISGTCR